MKVLWLSNNSPLESAKGGGGWFSSLAHNLKEQKEHIELVFVFPDAKQKMCSDVQKYYTFKKSIFDKPFHYKRVTEKYFLEIISNEKPDIIHIWGTEYYYSLAMVNAATKVGLIEKVIVHIQGLCFACKDFVDIGLPFRVIYGRTLHDLVVGGVVDIKHGFEKRAKLEIDVIKNVNHILGRTDWDRNLCYLVNDKAEYHYCREMLRKPFYEGKWTYENSTKHKIFISQAGYPIKGFHYFLKAFSIVLEKYPDAIVTVGGKNIIDNKGIKGQIYHSCYGKYIAKLVQKNNMQAHIKFLGPLSAEEMKKEYLSTHLFVLPSTIENSSNSLGEALMLGVPCIASFVGGTSSIIDDKVDGYLYQHDDIYSLAGNIIKLFESQEQCELLSENAVHKAIKLHDINNVVDDILRIYSLI